jgi:hypothetical protein
MRWISDDSSEIIECKIEFVLQIFAILFFSTILILHWNDHAEWLSSQFAHLRRLIDALQVMSLCDSKADETSFFVSTDADYVFISLTVEALFDWKIINEKIAYDMRVLVQ